MAPRVPKEAPRIEVSDAVRKADAAMFAMIRESSGDPVIRQEGWFEFGGRSYYKFMLVSVDEIEYLWERFVPQVVRERFHLRWADLANEIVKRVRGREIEAPTAERLAEHAKWTIYEDFLNSGNRAQRMLRKYFKSGESFDERKSKLNTIMNSARVSRDILRDPNVGLAQFFNGWWNNWYWIENYEQVNSETKDRRIKFVATRESEPQYREHVRRVNTTKEFADNATGVTLRVRDAIGQPPAAIAAQNEARVAAMLKDIPPMPFGR